MLSVAFSYSCSTYVFKSLAIVGNTIFANTIHAHITATKMNINYEHRMNYTFCRKKTP